MIVPIKKKVEELLQDGKIKGFLGLAEQHGQVCPFLFRDSKDLDNMSIGDWKQAGDARYPLNKFLLQLTRAYPDDTFAILVRGCDERGLKALQVWNQVDLDKIITVGLACPRELAEACGCHKPYPDDYVTGDKSEGSNSRSLSDLEELENPQRFAYWIKQFSKCIKCFGCRDVCPVCFCQECSLDSEEFIHTYNLPPQNPLFHLARASHMAGRCIDCGLCEEACPADIPLRSLYKKVGQIVDQEFGYRPGIDIDCKPPLNVAGQDS